MVFASLAFAPARPAFSLSPTPSSTSLKATLSAPRATRLRATSSLGQPDKTMTATPGKNKTALAFEKQAGTSDRIALLGALVVAIIVIPILLKQDEWRGK